MSIDRMTRAAMGIIDNEGLDALSMRRLASELHTGTAQLYRYVAGKDEVLVYVLDSVMGQVGASVALEGDWRARVESIAQGIRATFVAHPHLAALLASHMPIGPNAVVGREVFLQVLLDGGFDDPTAAAAYLAVIHYVVGYILVEVAEGDDHNEAGALTQYYRSLPPETYPALHALAGHLTQPDANEKFRYGLQFLLDGLQVRLGQTSTLSTSRL